MEDSELVECHFLVPLVRDGNRRPHQPSAWRFLQDSLFRRFGGRSGPEGLYVAIRPTPGEYKSHSGGRVEDESRRYIVAVEESRVDELKRFLARVANTFDQEAIYLSVRGRVVFVQADDGAGDLADEGEEG
ncbi:MAG: hypothetical protein JKY65_10980 [Planctomycetes bacterium]|nr:hypothetical protein [Planctomycetota bacterium]